jgi:hypothetical protein
MLEAFAGGLTCVAFLPVALAGFLAATGFLAASVAGLTDLLTDLALAAGLALTSAFVSLVVDEFLELGTRATLFLLDVNIFTGYKDNCNGGIKKIRRDHDRHSVRICPVPVDVNSFMETFDIIADMSFSVS